MPCLAISLIPLSLEVLQLSTEGIRERKRGSGNALDCVEDSFGRFIVPEQANCRVSKEVGTRRGIATFSHWRQL